MTSNKDILHIKIHKIENTIRDTPYHKGTEHHIGSLRARLSKLKEELYGKDRAHGGGGRGYAIKKHGHATVALIGPPSVGKSTLINKLANISSPVGSYDFTTTTVIPGMMSYRGAKIQFFDLPGLIEKGALGKGGGRQILAAARAADLFLLITDPDKQQSFSAITKELTRAGFRINQKPPEIQVKKGFRGGVRVVDSFSCFLPETVKEIAAEYGMKNGEVVFKERIKSLDLLIDAFSSSCIYVPAIVVLTKIDLSSPNQKKKIISGFMPQMGKVISVSAQTGEGIDKLKRVIWRKLDFIRVYLKQRQGAVPDSEPLILKKGISVKEMIEKINSDWLDLVSSASLWGKKAKFPGQTISLNYLLEDKDVVCLVK